MTYQDRNRLRAFADVVGVDAWHKSFKPGSQEVDLKVDVTFKEGRVGGEEDSPVQFRLRLRRATLAVVISETEPVEVLRDSIRRNDDAIEVDWESHNVKTKHHAALLAAGLSASLNPLESGASASLSAKAETSIDANQTLVEKMRGRHRGMKSRFQYDNLEQSFNWLIDCQSTDFLEGRPWEANEQPLMTLRDTRHDASRGIPPNVRVAVRCLREDLIITDIKIKGNVSFLSKITGNEEKLKLKAAEAYIRTKLCEVGLVVGDLSNDFAKVVLVDVMSKTES
ncbi:hypothetical protein [Agrobacterium cavarae]|uniref:hypothetical protein n=1 Tax=Agrobacterium cavarae TaxID=2528239 RepID=UPI0028A8B661|nr:hypothetical protein [Agrobacterium cavarae]